VGEDPDQSCHLQGIVFQRSPSGCTHSPRCSKCGAGGEPAEPTEECVWRDEGRHSSQPGSTEHLGFAGQVRTLAIGETFRLASELFEENAVFFLKVRDHGLLVLIDPASDDEQEEWQVPHHGNQ